jgi:release factor glutamine methyltransferase
VLDRICAAAARHLTAGGAVLLVHSELCDTGATCAALEDAGLRANVVARQHGTLGPLMRERRARLERAGLLRPGQTTEQVVVVRGG